MKFCALIILTLVLQTPGAHANPYVDEMQNYCEKKSPAVPATELSDLLEKLQNDYANQEARVKDPTGFVAALDNVIAHSDFAGIPQCRDKIRQAGYTFAMEFQNPADGDQSMAIETIEKKTTMYFNLTKSVQRVLFVYLHEMTHVCQVLESDSQSTVGDTARFSIFGEIEAFLHMNLAYRYFLPMSPRLCQAEGTGSDSKEFPLYAAYVLAEQELEQGNFAQSIVSSYSSSEDFYKENLGEIVDLKSPVHTYGNSAQGDGYQLNSLDSRLKELIKRLAIAVVEP